MATVKMRVKKGRTVYHGSSIFSPGEIVAIDEREAEMHVENGFVEHIESEPGDSARVEPTEPAKKKPNDAKAD